MATVPVAPVFGSIKPSQKQQLLETNYLNFTDGTNDFAQQYLPEIYEQEVERYGNRTLSGFLRMVGAEMPMTSDQIVWSEQNRLHIAYDACTHSAAVADDITFATNAAAGPAFVENVISVNQTIVIMNPANGAEVKALVTGSVTAGGVASISVKSYTAANVAPTIPQATAGLKIFVYGSEYRKGTTDNDIKSVTPSFSQFHNSPIIIKEKYAINGSDTAQIGWVEVATEDGTSGFLWYLKAESETRLRFEDYLEMAVVEGELAAAGSGVAGIAGIAYGGTQGLFAAIQDRGNVVSGFVAAGGLGTFDNILKNLDTQGAIEENMLFLNRSTSLDFDDMLAGLSAGANGGTAYGLFENSEEMALNLGFTGFRRGSYDFYKTDWKYLNDASTRGAMADNPIDGVLVPAGTSTVYDQILGTNIRRPFLHVRYRASEADDRRMKSWLTGSVGGAFTSSLDAMEVHFLSERCLVVQAANNFVLFTK
jgi:hypothetical protein|tara:strand:- start:1248 stop:2687 length:1440 start_codon:yes stop_codon:yes gene_type:complete